MRYHQIAKGIAVFAVSMLVPVLAFGATVTPLLESGPRTSKKNLVIIGDGFAAADQANWVKFVKDIVMDKLFTEGPLWEDQNAFNIYRIDVESQDSGVTQVTQEKDETMTPVEPPNGSRLAFTFSALAHLPLIEEISIIDPNSLKIVDNGSISTNPVPLKASNNSGDVTGSLDRTTGVVTLTYTSGHAPPAGSFIATYNYISSQKNTALEYRFAPHMHCYFRTSPKTQEKLDALLKLVPGYNYYSVILNEKGFGGCTGSGNDTMTTGAGWEVFAHESGHLVGGLCDEYIGTSDAYSGTEPGCPNATINNCSDRSTLKWLDFLDPNTPCPNTPDIPAGQNQFEPVGHWQGAWNASGIWRVAFNSRMNGNSNPFGPVSYDWMKTVLDDYHEHDFAKTYVGDFDGDGKSDLVIHNANTLELYISDGTHMSPKWVQTLPLDGWEFADNDQFLVGDFDGDGRDDLLTYNMIDFTEPRLAVLRAEATPEAGFSIMDRYVRSLPTWGLMKPTDRFYVADFDGDDKDDLYIVNTALTDWPIGFLGMVRSNGTTLEGVALYGDTLPGWDKMKPGDEFFVANVDGLGGKDLYVVNNVDWCSGYLQSLLSTGTGLVQGIRYDRDAPGWGPLLPGDIYRVADFEGTGREGLYATNSTEWPTPYLGVLRSQGSGTLDMPILHQGYVEGWGALMPNDRFLVANIDGSGGSDLYGFNVLDGLQRIVGRLIASPLGFQGSWQAEKIGKWQLTNLDVFHVANYNGTTGGAALDDLIVHIDPYAHEYLGLLSNNGTSLDGPVIYPKWIHHIPYHVRGYW